MEQQLSLILRTEEAGDQTGDRGLQGKWFTTTVKPV